MEPTRELAPSHSALDPQPSEEPSGSSPKPPNDIPSFPPKPMQVVSAASASLASGSPPHVPSRSASQNAVALQSMAGVDPQGERQLNVTDALTYLDAVKNQFFDRPDVYNFFLDIMKDFKSQRIDTPGVISRVSSLFHGHPALIKGFNTFLPVGYRIDVGSDSHSSEYITVTTPSGTVLQPTNGPDTVSEQHYLNNVLSGLSYPHMPIEIALGSSDMNYKGGDAEKQNLGPAMDYVQRIKTRFSDDPDTYKQFLEILSSHKSSANNAEVFAKVELLFKDAPDLSLAFREFLPGTGQRIEDGEDIGIQGMLGSIDSSAMGFDSTRSAKRKQVESLVSAGPAKRKRKGAGDKDKDKDKESGKVPSGSKSKKAKQQHVSALDASPSFSQYSVVALPLSPRRAAHPFPSRAFMPPTPPTTYRAPPISASISNAPPAGPDDTQFFARVRRTVDSRESYNEFLRIVNLFTQDYIDRARLIRESRFFLGDGDLMMQFKDILGWDDAQEKAALMREREEALLPGRPLAALERPSREELSIRHGSYRHLPADEVNVQCSGRDEMCRSVLNDEWVAHPTFASEDSGFIAHKKNIYEEALHRCEEERHEYDFHIDGIVKTISVLEPINNKIAQLGPEERNNFKLKPNFGGSAKAIHHRIIRKVYGREAGLEVIQAVQETPALAIPVVLGRLKQKEEEWKRAQREWNKVWREVDAQNYYKALDHRSITFKAADKKALTSKAFVSQIEAIMEEQMARQFVMDDTEVLKDAVKLTYSFLARMTGQQMRLDSDKRRWIEIRLYNVVRAFFMLGDDWVQNATKTQSMFVRTSDNTSGTASEAEGVASSSRTGNGRGKLAGNFSGDLRKNLLKSEQAKSTRSQTRPLQSPAGSRRGSPAPIPSEEEMQVDAEERTESAIPTNDAHFRKRRSFYTNTWFYTTLRLIEVIYSRLHLFKTLSIERSKMANAERPSDIALRIELSDGLANADATPAQYYQLFLETCERLFDNQMDQNVFEDQMRGMFGLQDAYKSFTIDKAVGALIKQHPESKVMTCQLLSKDGSSLDDAEVLTGRWQSYISSFVSEEDTSDVPASKVRRPFLRRNLPPGPRKEPMDVVARGGLEIKVCVRTYRLFFVSNTEDVLWRRVPREQREQALARLDARNHSRKLWLEKFQIPSQTTSMNE
ncbi:hypothetical protein EW146_g1003 [Bondarzewia mesenterica]|uniref:Histone deacetylase interacting domain-containing protein n=1 Tax=Bondarzewia mesenterica TaxID=1095465 RepID=A0A4V3XG71_9AGAM|nr:hypothetical protein EW146_g1003 [Bondarzewia mesenterica]